jgi:hypothetical protein
MEQRHDLDAQAIEAIDRSIGSITALRRFKRSKFKSSRKVNLKDNLHVSEFSNHESRLRSFTNTIPVPFDVSEDGKFRPTLNGSSCPNAIGRLVLGERNYFFANSSSSEKS